MSSKSQAAAKSAPAVKAVPPAAKTKRPRTMPPMTAVQKRDLMNYITDADTTLPDATVAENASKRIGRKVLPLTVTTYRRQFGIAPIGRPKAAQLAIDLAAAKARIAELEATLREFSTGTAAA